MITNDPYEKKRRRTLINSDFAGHKVSFMMLGIKKKTVDLESMGARSSE